MGGVQGWWDETSDPEVSDALDDLVRAGLSDEHAQGVEKPVYDEPPVTKEQVKAAAAKVMMIGPAGTNASTLTGTYTLAGATYTLSPMLYNSDKVNVTGEQYEKLKAAEQGLKKLAETLDPLTTAVMGLPSKEYKSVKKQLEAMALVMVELKSKGLI